MKFCICTSCSRAYFDITYTFEHFWYYNIGSCCILVFSCFRNVSLPSDSINYALYVYPNKETRGILNPVDCEVGLPHHSQNPGILWFRAAHSKLLKGGDATSCWGTVTSSSFSCRKTQFSIISTSVVPIMVASDKSQDWMISQYLLLYKRCTYRNVPIQILNIVVFTFIFVSLPYVTWLQKYNTSDC